MGATSGGRSAYAMITELEAPKWWLGNVFFGWPKLLFFRALNHIIPARQNTGAKAPTTVHGRPDVSDRELQPQADAARMQ